MLETVSSEGNGSDHTSGLLDIPWGWMMDALLLFTKISSLAHFGQLSLNMDLNTISETLSTPSQKIILSFLQIKFVIIFFNPMQILQK